MLRLLWTIPRSMRQVGPYSCEVLVLVRTKGQIDNTFGGACVTYHQQHAISTAHDLAEIHFRPRRVNVAALVEEILDGLVGREDNHDLGS